MLTSARLRLLGSRAEAVLMTNFNSQLTDAARPESKSLTVLQASSRFELGSTNQPDRLDELELGSGLCRARAASLRLAAVTTPGQASHR